MKQGFKFFDHTADIGLEVWAENEKSVFEEAAKGLFDLIAKPTQTIKVNEKIQIKLRSESIEELFFVWLQELLYLVETRKLFLFEFRINQLTEHKLTAEAKGTNFSQFEHEHGREVKAVTRHLFEFRKTGSDCRAKVILDI